MWYDLSKFITPSEQLTLFASTNPNFLNSNRSDIFCTYYYEFVNVNYQTMYFGTNVFYYFYLITFK